MRKLRFVLAIAIATMGLNACSTSPTSLDDDCNPEVEDCETIKPTTGH